MCEWIMVWVLHQCVTVVCRGGMCVSSCIGCYTCMCVMVVFVCGGDV